MCYNFKQGGVKTIMEAGQMELIKILIERTISRGWCLLLCAFAYGWGMGVASKSFLTGLLAFATWILLFFICFCIEALVRRD